MWCQLTVRRRRGGRGAARNDDPSRMSVIVRVRVCASLRGRCDPDAVSDRATHRLGATVADVQARPDPPNPAWFEKDLAVAGLALAVAIHPQPSRRDIQVQRRGPYSRSREAIGDSKRSVENAGASVGDRHIELALMPIAVAPAADNRLLDLEVAVRAVLGRKIGRGYGEVIGGIDVLAAAGKRRRDLHGVLDPASNGPGLE